MSDWIELALRSRRVRNVTLGSLGLLVAGTTGGALLANFTVAGMDLSHIRHEQPVQVAADADLDQGLVHDVALVVPDEPRGSTEADGGFRDDSY